MRDKILKDMAKPMQTLKEEEEKDGFQIIEANDDRVNTNSNSDQQTRIHII